MSGGETGVKKHRHRPGEGMPRGSILRELLDAADVEVGPDRRPWRTDADRAAAVEAHRKRVAKALRKRGRRHK